jgi:hypothetical protein
MHGPTIISGHETSLKQMALKDSQGRVLHHIPTVNAGTMHKIIHFVCLSHIDKFMQACNKIGIASVAVYPSHPRIDLRYNN